MNDCVEIRKSNIPDAGFGLFAKHDIHANTPIVYFKGKVFSRDAMAKLPLNKSVIDLDDNTCLYCDEDCLASYANDCVVFPTESRDLIKALECDAPFYDMHANVLCNAELTVYKTTKYHALLVSKCDIKAGDEICIHYGFSYWFICEFNRGGFITHNEELPDNIGHYPAFKAYLSKFYKGVVKYHVYPFEDGNKYNHMDMMFVDGREMQMPIVRPFMCSINKK